MKLKMLFALGASFATIGCATGGIVGEGGTRAISQSAAQTAAQQHPQIVAQFGGALGGNEGAYVASVGRKVAAQSGVQGGGAGAYTVTTLNSPVLNAFAVPGGYVYITRQLLGLMDDEAELASVLGHEVGHIAADHSRGRQNQGLLSQILAAGVGIVTGSGDLAQIVGQGAQLYTLNYSRSQEYEADALGIRYMAGAGYDANAAASLLASLGAAEALDARVQGRNDQRAAPSWARSHPLSADRVRRATALAAEVQRPGVGVRNRDQFLNVVDGLIWEDDPAQGVIRGNSFLQPDLRLRFSVPAGYGIQNGTSAVSITGPNGQAQFSTGSFSGNLGTYIGQVFQGLAGQQAQISVPQPRSTTVNGIPAAWTTAQVNTQQGQVDVTVFAYRWDADTAYHFAMITPAGSGIGPFNPMVQSLSRLSASEAAAIRPRVIDVVTVQRGDTAASLAARMAYDDFKLERFLVLNSLDANTPLSPGTKVKLAVYGQRSG